LDEYLKLSSSVNQFSAGLATMKQMADGWNTRMLKEEMFRNRARVHGLQQHLP
jgi:hypothetical protein